MDFINLDDVLTGLADCVSVRKDIEADPDYAEAAKCSRAAELLYQALRNSPESRPRWKDLNINGPVSDDALFAECMTMLKHTAGWYGRETKRRCDHVESCLKVRLDPNIKLMGRDMNGGKYPRVPFLRSREIGFDRAELVSFLENKKVEHALLPGKPAAQVEPSSEQVTRAPGKIPKVAIGKFAVQAAWGIEHPTGRRASAKDVMERLRLWATDGTYSDVLSKVDKGDVVWLTNKGTEKKYGQGACEKTLAAWHKSRQ